MITQPTAPSRQERRVRKTRSLILNGFIHLMQQKPVKDISVRELADLVDINRSTFYLHYTDIYDLLEQTETNLMNEFLSIIGDKKQNSSTTVQEFAEKLEHFFVVLAENKSLCLALMSPNGDIAFVRKLESVIAENSMETLRMISNEEAMSPQDLQYVTGFFLSGCVGLVEMWLQQSNAPSAQHMADLALKMLRAGVQGVTNLKL